MSKIKSLQYLLLDSLNKRDKSLYKNLSKTLKVNENNSYYIINWLDDWYACLLFDHIRSKHYEERKMFEGDAAIVERSVASSSAEEARLV